MSLCFNTDSSAVITDCEDHMMTSKCQENKSVVQAWLLYLQETEAHDKVLPLIHVGLTAPNIIYNGGPKMRIFYVSLL